MLTQRRLERTETKLMHFKRKATWTHENQLNAFLMGQRANKARGTFDSAKNHKGQRRKRQSVTAKREKSQTPKFV